MSYAGMSKRVVVCGHNLSLNSRSSVQYTVLHIYLTVFSEAILCQFINCYLLSYDARYSTNG